MRAGMIAMPVKSINHLHPHVAVNHHHHHHHHSKHTAFALTFTGRHFSNAHKVQADSTA